MRTYVIDGNKIVFSTSIRGEKTAKWFAETYYRDAVVITAENDKNALELAGLLTEKREIDDEQKS